MNKVGTDIRPATAKHSGPVGGLTERSEPLDLGGLLGENVFSTLTGDWTPQHNDEDYKLGSIADTAIVSGLHSATMLPSMARRAAVLDKSERLRDLRMDRLRWIKPILVGARPEWKVTVETAVDDRGRKTVTSRHSVETDGDVHLVAEHVGVVVSHGQAALSALSGLDRELAFRDRPQGMAADPSSIYDPAYLARLCSLVGPRYLGVTPWITLSQFEADAFAEVSGGRHPWHNDDVGLATTNSKTVLHAMHLVSFAPWAAKQVGMLVAFDGDETFGTGMAYGLDDVRWVEDIPVGMPLRVHVTLEEVVPRGPDRFVVSMRQEFERQGSPFVALTLVWKLIILTAEPV